MIQHLHLSPTLSLSLSLYIYIYIERERENIYSSPSPSISLSIYIYMCVCERERECVCVCVYVCACVKMSFFIGLKIEKSKYFKMKWSLKRSIFLKNYLFRSYIRVCFQLVAFDRELMRHKAIWMKKVQGQNYTHTQRKNQTQTINTRRYKWKKFKARTIPTRRGKIKPKL